MEDERAPSGTSRRSLLRYGVPGTLVTALGAWYVFADDERTRRARGQVRADGRPRLPDGQKVITRLKDMGGAPGAGRRKSFGLRVHGEVLRPLDLDFEALMRLPQRTAEADVHCVTGWSVLGETWTGVPIAELAELALPTSRARFVVLEAAHGYTANIRLADALHPESMVVHRHRERALAPAHGAPVRGLVPNLYFWKSPKWLTGVRFEHHDPPGYWEVRGYHNRADPWKEQRYG